ncbi:hypothetical protein D8Y22_05435 [Salinadaptatus halalkaliphilus]|uniref:Uncharacterized protein n=1 Tax=Salinadaptatus halalkaliphilus TaxID=2419781 RepID=A0A4V3VLI9_9EURY|nr:hypothetical protein D8Y22_05435 [Salinadaptatus halalkaliphilus]
MATVAGGIRPLELSRSASELPGVRGRPSGDQTWVSIGSITVDELSVKSLLESSPTDREVD